MLQPARKLTKREEEFLAWLLDPRLLGERVPGSTKKDARKITRAIKQLQQVSPSGLLATRIKDLEDDQAQLEYEIHTKRTVYKSAIQSRSYDGRENMEQSERLFLAALIARKRGPRPYEFLHARFTKPHFTAKAIEMRVRRFEERIAGLVGPMSCSWIARREYSQFLTQRRQKQLLAILNRYQTKKIQYRKYCNESNSLMMPNVGENRWLEALCRHAVQ